MNLWDSVHRGLEKASQEAARLARTQRLRANIDGLMRHINTQHTMLIGKTMELYANGQLMQSELVPICQALTELQQQIQQAQNELRQLQANLPAPQTPPLSPGTAPQTGATMPYLAPGEPGTGPYPPSPDYQSYVDVGPITAPPPPPGAEPFAIGEMETMMTPPPPPPPMEMPPVPPPVPASAPAGMNAPRYCPVCQAELNPNHAFCHNCGTLVQDNVSSHMPTTRASAEMTFAAEGQETMRAGTPADINEQETMRAGGNITPPPAEENKGV